jgi:hypothetical protein
MLRPVKDDSKEERNDPEDQCSGIKHLPQRCTIIVEIAIQASGHFKPCGYQEPPYTPDAADENMSRDKSNYVTKATGSHQEENKACDN